PFMQQPMVYRDGAGGEKGGVAILRMRTQEKDELCAVMKYSAHGMGHGHFDKLSYSCYDELGEIIQDYGAARWVNIDQKGGGRYLPENKTFAKQSIAHNTLVVDEQSHYEGSVKKGEAHHPDLYFSNLTAENHQLVSAKDLHAYPGVEMHRTLILIDDKQLKKPMLVDVFRANAATARQYDLPLWFQGHLLQSSFDYQTESSIQKPLGTANGYQHIWKEATGKSDTKNAKLTWLNKGNFFTMTSLVDEQDELIFGRLGADDPAFNLRRDPCFLIRKKQVKEAVFISVVEAHGSYDPVTEIPTDPFSQLESIDLIHQDEKYTLFEICTKTGTWSIFLANQDAAPDQQHELLIHDEKYVWQGAYQIQYLTNKN
ncbi:MAG: heparinase II/III family protein, partial [Bacteroidota bacterium]